MTTASPEENNLICIMRLPQDQALDLLHYYEFHGVDYCIMELDKEINAYDILVPESKMQDIQPFTDAFFIDPRIPDTRNPAQDLSPKGPAQETSSTASPVYKNKSGQLEDVKSTAYTFLLVGVIVLIISILIYFS